VTDCRIVARFVVLEGVMTALAGSLLAVAAVLVSLARRTAGRPPLWRSRVAFGGAVVCVLAAVGLAMIDPTILLDSPVLFAVALCLFEGASAMISLRAAKACAVRARVAPSLEPYRVRRA